MSKKLRILLDWYSVDKMYLAKRLKISYSALQKKINGQSRWWLDEALTIQEVLEEHGHHEDIASIFNLKTSSLVLTRK